MLWVETTKDFACAAAYTGFAGSPLPSSRVTPKADTCVSDVGDESSVYDSLRTLIDQATRTTQLIGWRDGAFVRSASHKIA